jgi:hypothetical protein
MKKVQQLCSQHFCSFVMTPLFVRPWCAMVCVAGILQVWNVSQQQPLHSLKVGSTPAQSLNFFPGSSRALITFQDGTVSTPL